MIESFLRPATTAGQVAADILRILGVVSVLVALLWGSVTDAAIVAFSLPGLMMPRFLGMRPWADLTVGTALLVAAWSNVLEVYTAVWWWDILIHVVLAGALAAVVYLVLARWNLVAQPGAPGTPTAGLVLLTTGIGLALGALWEMVEWFGYVYITPDIFVTYADTIGDMAVGGLGAVGAGVILARGPQLLMPTAAEMSESSSTEPKR